MTWLEILLAALLVLSLAGNGYLLWRWRSYRGKAAGVHSHTGMMPRVDRDGRPRP
jgi:hypothetical protein